jgi:uncharacterized protein (TIGR02145 family)
MKKSLRFLMIIGLCSLMTACGGQIKSDKTDTVKLLVENDPNTFTDSRDGKVYKTVKIGDQIWMAENLNYEMEGTYYLGDTAEVYYNKYGRLYSRKAAMLASPPGWHLPTKEEWNKLTEYLGGKTEAGDKMKSLSGWGKYSQATNSSGFTALSGGGRGFGIIGYSGLWWTSTQEDSDSFYYRYLKADRTDILYGVGGRNEAFSVRCVKD